MASQRSIAVAAGVGPKNSDDAIQPRMSIRSCSRPPLRACSAASSHAAAAASARASIQLCQPRSRSALQRPRSSPAASKTGITRSTTAMPPPCRRFASVEPQELALGERARRGALVAAAVGRQGRVGEHGVRIDQPARLDQGRPQHRQQLRAAAHVAGREGHRPLEERHGRGPVAAPQRAVAGGLQPLRAARGERLGLLAAPPELDQEAVRLLEVVAEDLLELVHALAGRSLEPVREALVELGARLLRQRAVGGVPEQDVAELEGLVVGEARPVGPDHVAPDQRRQAPVDAPGQGGGRERAHRLAVEDAALDRDAREQRPLLLRQAVEARAEQRLDGGRHR